MQKIDSLNQENINQLREKLSQKGFTPEEIDGQFKKLGDLVLLSSLKRLAKSKDINLAELKLTDKTEIGNWLNQNFTDKEIADATFEASSSTLAQYLKILEG